MASDLLMPVKKNQENMMSTKKIFGVSIWSSLPCALVCMLYMFFPAPLGGLMWCMFVGYCTTNFAGASFKKLPITWGNYALGVIWALLFWFAYLFLVSLEIPTSVAMLLDVWIVTAALCVVALGPLKKTPLNIIPLYFPCVFTLFASGGDFTVYPWMVVSIFIGSLTAMIGNAIWERIQNGKENAAQKSAIDMEA